MFSMKQGECGDFWPRNLGADDTNNVGHLPSCRTPPLPFLSHILLLLHPCPVLLCCPLVLFLLVPPRPCRVLVSSFFSSLFNPVLSSCVILQCFLFFSLLNPVLPPLCCPSVLFFLHNPQLCPLIPFFNPALHHTGLCCTTQN